MPSGAADQTLDVAIIGGGITGLTMAVGLVSRGFHVKVYERKSGYSKIETTIAFTPNTEWAMRVLDPRIYGAFKQVATSDAKDRFSWINAYGDDHITPVDKKGTGKGGFESCQRSKFIAELSQLLPKGCVVFEKELDVMRHRGEDKKMLLRFKDKTIVEADIVIGCDGIHSRVRQYVIGEDEEPGYAHKYVFRGLIRSHKVNALVGKDIGTNRYIHLGQGAHAVTFPVADGELFNVVAFVKDAKELPDKRNSIDSLSKKEVVKAFRKFPAITRAIIDLLPDQIDRWVIFDTFDDPATTYIDDRMCLAGDAAHPASPHHGAGAGMGVEDAAALVSLLELAKEALPDKRYRKTTLIQLALEAYDRVRLNRTLWLVETSWFSGELYEWQHGNGPATIWREVNWRARKTWPYNIDEINRQAMEEFIRSLSTMR
ncbi:FAD-dependent oxidoreductase [Aspergillus stella-maris]|uniref:FAD-dependent oxidoreductase n=1 Tax=Aspergillus stella-maris TaxID=1810926 RepID=UPI003CCDDC0B